MFIKGKWVKTDTNMGMKNNYRGKFGYIKLNSESSHFVLRVFCLSVCLLYHIVNIYDESRTFLFT